ncbi:MAG: YggS family pyridoxal phosphate-dependent enzyme [Terriglobales bacterium]
MSLAEHLDQACTAIAAACARRGRDPGQVRLLAATKTVAADQIREIHRLGIRVFGENRVQEAEAKRADLADLAAEWHLIGPLQANKAARALSFDCLETLDSLPLAQRLSRLAAAAGRPALPVLLEINLAREPQKAGVAPEAALELAQQIAMLPALALRGLMAVPPAAADPEASRPHFARLAELAAEVRAVTGGGARGWEISMGMSHDFVVAVEEGATLVRLGTALFGKRS